jgi:hypothetical protein
MEASYEDHSRKGRDFCLLTMAAISVVTVVSSHVLMNSTVFSTPANAEPFIGQ